jgi:cytochrome c553
VKRLLACACLLALATGATGAHAAGDAAAGKAKSATCAGCHGADGNSANALWPKLAGQGEAYLVKQLTEFKSGARKDPTMAPMAAPLSEQDIADLAAHFSSMSIKPGTAAEDQVAAGQRLYRGGNSANGVAACASCHGPGGAGNPAAKFPALGGQHASYTAKQLADFKSGARDNDSAGMMQAVAAKLTDADIKAVSEYMAGLH